MVGPMDGPPQDGFGVDPELPLPIRMSEATDSRRALVRC